MKNIKILKIHSFIAKSARPETTIARPNSTVARPNSTVARPETTIASRKYKCRCHFPRNTGTYGKDASLIAFKKCYGYEIRNF
jgi:hypothetical protein